VRIRLTELNSEPQWEPYRVSENRSREPKYRPLLPEHNWRFLFSVISVLCSVLAAICHPRSELFLSSRRRGATRFPDERRASWRYLYRNCAPGTQYSPAFVPWQRSERTERHGRRVEIATWEECLTVERSGKLARYDPDQPSNIHDPQLRCLKASGLALLCVVPYEGLPRDVDQPSPDQRRLWNSL